MFIDLKYTFFYNTFMSKAYTQNERIKIRKNIQETALKAFKESGVKNVTIRQLAKEAGISLGGFYNFYLDKDELLLDLVCQHTGEKINTFISTMNKQDPSYITSPLSFISSTFYKFAMELKNNKTFPQSSDEILGLLIKSFDSKLSGYLIPEKDLIDFFENYWTSKGTIIRVDREGLLQAERTAFVMLRHSKECGSGFENTFRLFIDSCVNEFFSISEGYI